MGHRTHGTQRRTPRERLSQVRRTRQPLVIEPLERRTLLTVNAPDHVFAHFDGVLTTPADTRTIPITIAAEDFTLADGKAVLGFHTRTMANSTLDPKAVWIQRADGQVVQPLLRFDDRAGQTQSLMIAELPPGNYMVTVGGERGTAGAFQLDVSLVGDLDGNRSVDLTDGYLVRDAFGSTIGESRYRIEADANLDDRITSLDYAIWRRNLGVSTQVDPLNLGMEIVPEPGRLADGTLVAEVAEIGVVGQTLAGITVSLDIDGDGQFDEGQATADSTGHYTLAATLSPGANTLSVRASDRFGQQQTVAIQITLAESADTEPPMITAALAHDTSPGGGINTDGITSDPTVTGVVSDASAIAHLRAEIDPPSTASPLDVTTILQSEGTFTLDQALLEQVHDGPLLDGAYVLHIWAEDEHGNLSDPFDLTFTLDTSAPDIVFDNLPALTNTNVVVTGRVTDTTSDVALLEAQVDSGPFVAVSPSAAGPFQFDTTLPLDGSADGDHTIRLRATDLAGNVATSPEAAFLLDTTIPPDPATVAPPLDRTVATTIAASSEFLYTGSNPIQVGVAPDTINPIRAARLRGRVLTRDGEPLPGVTVTVLDHPEFGHTRTRLDGRFDLVVNGGGQLTLSYAKDGLLPAQRQLDVPWQDYAYLPDVVLISLDEQVTTIDLDAATSFQVARGSEVTDNDGTRQATLLFPAGTQAQMVMPDGSTQKLTSLNVRATEYTVGGRGPNAMPAELPPSSAYTYAVELSADEALAAGATSVTFSQPVLFYLENFIGFPVDPAKGGVVPTGYYDRQQGLWIPSESGRVVEIVSITGGLADLDLTGDGLATADDAPVLVQLGIDDAERQRLASLYEPGQSLWRVPIPHFSALDHNWGFGPPDDAEYPDLPEPIADHPVDDPNEECGCIIEAENQILGEAVAVVGTPYSLNYRSDRVSGYTAANTLTIPLSGPTVPPSLARIDLEIEVAGREFKEFFSSKDGSLANKTATFTWDGIDSDGRMPQGQQPVTVRIGYVYGGVYGASGEFGSVTSFVKGSSGGGGGGGGGTSVPVVDPYSRISGNREAFEIVFWQEHRTTLGTWNSLALGLGGWSLDVHHSYDPIGRILQQGDGTRRSTEALSPAITTVIGGLHLPVAVAVGPDGSLYFEGRGNGRVGRVDPDGVITTVAGGGNRTEDGIPATQARIRAPHGLAVGPDGSLYIADWTDYRIRRVSPDGIITTVAGTGTYGFSGDGGPATQARDHTP